MDVLAARQLYAEMAKQERQSPERAQAERSKDVFCPRKVPGKNRKKNQIEGFNWNTCLFWTRHISGFCQWLWDVVRATIKVLKGNASMGCFHARWCVDLMASYG